MPAAHRQPANITSIVVSQWAGFIAGSLLGAYVTRSACQLAGEGRPAGELCGVRIAVLFMPYRCFFIEILIIILELNNVCIYLTLLVPSLSIS